MCPDTPGVHPAIPPSPLMFPSTIMGTHTTTLLVCETGVTSSPPAAWRVVCGCCFYEGLGHWLGVGGALGVPWGVSGPFPAFVLKGSTKIFSVLFYSDNL